MKSQFHERAVVSLSTVFDRRQARRRAAAVCVMISAAVSLAGCGLVGYMVELGGTGHHQQGRVYQQEAEKTNDDLDGLRERVRLLELAEKEYEAGSKWEWVDPGFGPNESSLRWLRKDLEERKQDLVRLEEKALRRQKKKAELVARLEEHWDNYWEFQKHFAQFEKAFPDHPRLPEFRARLKEHRDLRLNELVARAKRKLAEGKPAAAFGDVGKAERIAENAENNEDLRDLRGQLWRAFSQDPSQIAHMGQAEWFYRPKGYFEVLRSGLSKDTVFQGPVTVLQKFDYGYYQARYMGENGIEVVIHSTRALHYGHPNAVFVGLLKVVEERRLQRSTRGTVVLPVVEILFPRSGSMFIETPAPRTPPRSPEYKELVDSIKQKIAAGRLWAAHSDLSKAKALAGPNEELSSLWARLRGEFARNPSQIDGASQARRLYEPLDYVGVVYRGLSVGVIFEEQFTVGQRFDRSYYRARFGGPDGMDVVIRSHQTLPHGHAAAMLRAIVEVKEERRFQRVLGGAEVLPVVEILFKIWP